MKLDFECYRCKSEGWIINSLGVYITCPVCHNSRTVRILKSAFFKLSVTLFELFSDLLTKINWVSEDTLRFERLYNVELEGKIIEAQKPPFESYEQVFKEGNPVLKNKVAYKIIYSYVTGYSERIELVGQALEALTGSQELLSLAEKTHNDLKLGKDTTANFYSELDAHLN